MVLSQRAGVPVVDLYKEGTELFSGFIGLWLENGKLIKAEKEPNKKPVEINAALSVKEPKDIKEK